MLQEERQDGSPRPYRDPVPRPTDQLEVNPAPSPGHQAMVLAGLCIGLLLLGVQLWLLTVALDLFLAGADQPLWLLPLVSGLIFLGGLFVLWVLQRQHQYRR